MSLNANQSKNSGTSQNANKNPLQGTFPARLVGVVDLGLQPQPAYQGQEKPPVYQFALTYELVDEFLKDENDKDLTDKPRWVSENMALYGLSAEKAKSTLRYNVFDPTHSRDGDWTALLGSPAMVTIVHNPGKGNNSHKIYEKIVGVSAMRDKDAAKCPELVNEPFAFDLDNPDMDVWNRMPKWMQERVKKNLEFKGSKLDKLLGSTPQIETATNEPDFQPEADMDDEIPF